MFCTPREYKTARIPSVALNVIHTFLRPKYVYDPLHGGGISKSWRITHGGGHENITFSSEEIVLTDLFFFLGVFSSHAFLRLQLILFFTPFCRRLPPFCRRAFSTLDSGSAPTDARSAFLLDFQHLVRADSAARARARAFMKSHSLHKRYSEAVRVFACACGSACNRVLLRILNVYSQRFVVAINFIIIYFFLLTLYCF